MKKNLIYLNHASTSWPKPNELIKAIESCLKEPPSGRSNLTGETSLHEAKRVIARFFNASNVEQFIFSQNVTYCINLVFKGLLLEGDSVGITCAEHASVIRPLKHMEEDVSIKLHILPINIDGSVDTQYICNWIEKNKPRVFLISHASNVLGTIYDIKTIGVACRNAGTLFFVDASQTAGSIAIDVDEIGCDALFFTGHKGMLGPSGIGGVYLRNPEIVSPVFSGGTGLNSRILYQPLDLNERFEIGTPNLLGIQGLAASLEWLSSQDWLERKAIKNSLRSYLLEKLHHVPKCIMYGNNSLDNTGVVSFNIEGKLSSDVSEHLAGEGMVVRGGLHCAPLLHRQMGTFSTGMVRLSLGCDNTKDEMDTVYQSLLEFCS
jgi:selenocysteine lyase/cysteine desulfurase